MSERHQLSHDEISSYIHRCVMKLRGLWTDTKVNRSGLRATFRRWHPTIENQDPSLKMCSELWEYMGAPGATPEAATEPQHVTDEQVEIIDQAAVVTAIVAIAGDHEGQARSFGGALQECGLSDLRLMRLLTVPAWGRLETIVRAAKRLDAAGIPIAWTRNETRRVRDFLFGYEHQVRRAVNEWASEFFRARGRSSDDADAESATTSETETTN